MVTCTILIGTLYDLAMSSNILRFLIVGLVASVITDLPLFKIFINSFDPLLLKKNGQ